MSGAAAGAGGLMSCVREASLEPPYTHTQDNRHGTEGRKGRFLRGLRRMFRRRRQPAEDASPDSKSRSTSELLDADHRQRRKEGAYGSGLSVSHDSVFTGDRSGDESSDERAPVHAAPHLHSGHRAELVAALRRRGRGDGSDDDEDLGLPRSPPASPPTDKADKRHHAGISQSSCSDGSLLSVGSSEMDEDSSSGTHHHSHDHSNRSDTPDFYMSSEPPSGVAPLSHSAAKHKMAVRPRRTHGAPRRKKNNPIATTALPITPELNEEMIRSTTPDVTTKRTEVVTESFSSSTTTKQVMVTKEHQQLISNELTRVIESTPSEIKLKSSSLPPGLALSQLVGQSPAKLSVADPSTPRSSIKRSKSSSQGKSIDSYQESQSHKSETKAYTHYHTQERVSRYRSAERYEERCESIDKKSKTDKKNENDVIRASSKKEESFFSRLLLRKSGKKKKESIESDSVAKKKSENVINPQYRHVDREKSGFTLGDLPNTSKDKSAPKSAGQRAFSNQAHKRIDNKGVYVHDFHREAAKLSVMDYDGHDLKIAEETDRILNMEHSKHYKEELIRPKRVSSKELIDDTYNKDSFNLNYDRNKRPPLTLQRLVDHSSITKSFINHEKNNYLREINMPSPKLVIEEESPIPAPRLRNNHNDFGTGSMPKNIPYLNHNIKMSASVSPPKNLLHQSCEFVRHINRSSEHISSYKKDFVQQREVKNDSYQNFQQSNNDYVNIEVQKPIQNSSTDSRYVSNVGKSNSFRFIADNSSIDSEDNQMPSLPAIVGISEPLMDSWEVNYRRSVSHEFSDKYEPSKRLSARNFNLYSNSAETYDSLPSTDSSYLDSLKNEHIENETCKNIFKNNLHIAFPNKRNSDISQIEAKIDTLIGSPKPYVPPILKSSSLDSVKSVSDKQVDERRKTIIVESNPNIKSKPSLPLGSKDGNKSDTEGFISVTHLNNEQTMVEVTQTDEKTLKMVKSEDKTQNETVRVPEFLKIQLNKVDSKPVSNVVLTANIATKKLDCSFATLTGSQTDSNMKLGLSSEISQQSEMNDNENNKTKETIAEEKCVDSKIVTSTRISPSIGRKPELPILCLANSVLNPKSYVRQKAASIEINDNKSDKPRTNSLSNDTSDKNVCDVVSNDQKLRSSFGSKSSIQSSDSNESRTLDKSEEGVVLRKKPIMTAKDKSGRKNDDEPELMKVFARRSLKLKDSEAESLAQEIAEANNCKDELVETMTASKSKILKNEFNSSIKSRDSDKENDDNVFQDSNKKQDENISVDIATRLSHFGVPHYQRSISVTSVSGIPNTKRESAPSYKTDVQKYKKEISDSTPEKRLRNRTFPDPSTDRDIEAKNEFKNDTKRSWLQNKKDGFIDKKLPLRNLSVESKDENSEAQVISDNRKESELENCKDEEKEKGADGEDSPQFPLVLQMRAEWERRAKQGMTK